MNVILLSGGSGKRLWPLSSDAQSKQFLKIFIKDDGTHESMMQRMYRMLKDIDPDVLVTIAAPKNQITQIQTQIVDNIGISIEPSRKDTFPAIMLAAAYLKKNGMREDESIVVCPVDAYVKEDYFECLKKMSHEAGKANLTCMGIEPTYPSEKYGYIIPVSSDVISPVKEFKEKPSAIVAKEYIKQGALWNGGVFAFKLSYLLKMATDLVGTADYDTLFQKYDTLQKISFDYAVAEKEKSINVIRFKGEWKDIGTWNTFSEVIPERVSGDAIIDSCINTHVINELGVPVVVLGIHNAVVVATPDGILVTDKDKSAQLKALVPNSRSAYGQISTSYHQEN